MTTTTMKLRGRGPAKNPTQTVGSKASALVHLHCGVPITDSLAIAREFRRLHKDVLRALDNLIEDGTLNERDFAPVAYTDTKGEKRRAIELTERGALVAMPFIGGRNARAGQVRLVDAFLAMRKQLTARKGTDWIKARREAADNYAVVSEMLAMRREAEGKATKAHHYANEARLINFAFAGTFAPIDRGELTQPELRILSRLEIRNSALIGMGKTYEERKVAMVAYAADLRAAQVARLQEPH
ncbi:Rha family transcriptional regulator [Cupriavidus necator]|uniref:Uncharacterized protein n=1 Tax=Cupriavidus necator TaxID=106590 RepID=A0A367PJT7_CUPNE|nr:Rha family transcriptional regulator [Cupriavidus necator]QQX83738.1 Rha family transcriptional regulator [Cupriavidus necator]RCJ07305.1 hypothetical protein DDK22_16625 [Cupriavidus necator]